MPALIGRKLRLKKGPSVSAVAIVGSQEDSPTINNGEVDITDKDDNGYRTLLDDWGVRSIDISIKGILKDDEFLEIVSSNSGAVLLQEYTLDMDAFGQFTGDFWVQNVQIGAPTNEGVTFTSNLLSSGPFVFTPVA